eukprot:763313-Hanusia_phi.AAC.1
MKERARLTGHSGTVMNVAMSRDGKTAVSGSKDFTVRVWDLEGMKERARLTGHSGGVNSVSLCSQVVIVGSALHVAALGGSWSVCEALLEVGGRGLGELRDSAGRRAAEVARERPQDMLASSIEDWLRREESWDYLVAAVQGGEAEAVRRLVEGRADLTRQDKNGWTALHWAAYEGQGEIVQCLVMAGGRQLREVRCKAGHTAGDLATLLRKQEAVAAVEAAERADQEKDRRLQELYGRAQQLTDKYRSEEGQAQRLLSIEEYKTLVEHALLAADKQTAGDVREEERFKSDPKTLVCGEFKHAARGLEQLLQVPLKEVYKKLEHAMEKLREEVKAYGNADLTRDLQYVLSEAAREEQTGKGTRDKGHGGMRLRDFMQHHYVKEARLSEEEVAALR